MKSTSTLQTHKAPGSMPLATKQTFKTRVDCQHLQSSTSKNANFLKEGRGGQLGPQVRSPNANNTFSNTQSPYHNADPLTNPQTNVCDTLNLPAGITSTSFSTCEVLIPSNNHLHESCASLVAQCSPQYSTNYPEYNPTNRESIHRASTLPAGNANTGTGTCEASNTSYHLPGKH